MTDIKRELSELLQSGKNDGDKLWQLLRLLQGMPNWLDGILEERLKESDAKTKAEIKNEIRIYFQDLSFLTGRFLETELKPELKKYYDDVKIEVAKELERLKRIKALEAPIKGKDYFDGKDGRNGQDGRDGRNGTDGRDGKDGEKGETGKQGEKGRDGSLDTGNQIVEKINSSDAKIDASHIKNLSKETTIIKKGGGMTIRPYDLTSFCNGVDKIFVIPLNNGVLGVWGTQDPKVYRPIIDFTYTTTQLILTSEVSAPEDRQTLWCQYIEG